MRFEHTAFAQLIAGTGGRIARVVAGLCLIGIGTGVIGGTWGAVIAVIGLVPLAAGAFDFCVLSPLFKGPFSGKAIRAAGRSEDAPPRL